VFSNISDDVPSSDFAAPNYNLKVYSTLSRYSYRFQMAKEILEGTLQHECLSNEAIRAIINHLRELPMVQQIWKPTVTPEDFTSCFKGVPEKTASFYSGRAVPHYKACCPIKEE
jgi:hypothetical protein